MPEQQSVDSRVKRNGARLSEADPDVFAKLAEQRLERGEEAQHLRGVRLWVSTISCSSASATVATLADAFAHVGKQQPPDVAILDLTLREHSVEPFARALVADRVPFVVITGHPELPKGIFSGAPIVEKPFGAAELARAIAEAVGRA